MSTGAKRIAIYVPSLNGGGAERVMAELANSFATRGHIVDLLLVKVEGPYLAILSPQVNVIDLNSSRALFSIVPLARYFRKYRPAAVLSALDYANVIAICARFVSGCKFRLVISERSNVSASRGMALTLRAKLTRKIMEVSYRKADQIIAVSQGVANDMIDALRLPPNLVRVIYNPIDTDRIRQLSLAPIAHEWLNDPGTPLIVAAGRLNMAKDFPTLIKAFAMLRLEQRAKLIILGEGEQRDALFQLIVELDLEDDVLLFGFVANPFVWMRRASLFVLSSAWEGLPGTLLQAMACGTVVVSTDCHSGPAEILEGGRWGRLVPVGAPAQLADAMTQALCDPIKPDVESRARYFSADRAVDAYAEALAIN